MVSVPLAQNNSPSDRPGWYTCAVGALAAALATDDSPLSR